MSLHVQQYLRNLGRELTSEKLIDSLKALFGIKARRHAQHPNLVLFKYDMIDSPMAEPIVRECRGIVLDEDENWAVVARAFDKFFNSEEGHAAEIDWTTARVQEKVDGSLCTVYEYKGAWHVATSGTPDASGDINRTGTIFSEYFWHTLGGVERCPDVDGAAKHISFFFELTGPMNRIVVPHTTAGLTLLGARDRRTGQELHPQVGAELFGPHCPKVVKEFPLTTSEEIVNSFVAISPLSQEGYVVVDAAFNRVKMKHPGYVALHHAKDGMTTKAFVQIARSGETSEVVAAFPEFGPLVQEARSRVDALVAEVEGDYERLKHIEVQKDFAMEATKTRLPSALFTLRRGMTESIRAFVRDMQIGSLMEHLGYGKETL
jgi:hypothetical protein